MKLEQGNIEKFIGEFGHMKIDGGAGEMGFKSGNELRKIGQGKLSEKIDIVPASERDFKGVDTTYLTPHRNVISLFSVNLKESDFYGKYQVF